MDKEPQVIDFEIDSIPLDEAMRLVAGGSGKYGEIAQTLIERLRNRKDNETFCFGLPNGKELPEAERRGISTSLTTAFRRVGLSDWRCSYSSQKKIFLVVLKPNKTAPKVKEELPKKSQKYSTHLSPDERPEHSKITLRWLIPLALKVGNSPSTDVKTAPQAVRKALARIAVQDLSVRMEDVAKPLGISKSGVKYLLLSRGAEEVTEKLRAALPTNGANA